MNDGRLVLKVAAQNRGSAPVPFGPASVSVSRPDGRPIGRLIETAQALDRLYASASR
jgi:hypothetical protein